LLIAAATAAPGLVLARHRNVSDPSDVRGPLDIRRVAVTGKPRVWIIETFARWRARRIWDKGYFVVRFDTFRSPRYDYFLLARSNGSRMTAALYRDRKRKSDFRVAHLRSWRLSRRDVRVRVRLSVMKFGRKRTSYRWYAQSLFTGSRCRNTCLDRAPNRRAISEPLRAGSTSALP
jgi:hypothetical protein